MKEINIARTIVTCRKEKGITQEELARYMGVSKASVSKWETGLSYPDITFLPHLATYFNISIDDLLGYEPQMTKDDICKLYRQLCSEFCEKPFNEVVCRCREITKKYYSCFPLLFQIGALLVNYSILPKDTETTINVLTEAKDIFVRIKQESHDPELSKMALDMEALCLLSIGNPQEVLELLDRKVVNHISSTETLVASAYQMIGNNDEAKTVLQIGAYQYLIQLIESLKGYLALCSEDIAVTEEVYRRINIIAETFHMNKLHPAILMPLYLISAQSFLSCGNKERALDMLENYAEIVCGDIYPLQLHGDDFFTRLDGWFDTFEIGVYPPRDEKTIKQSMVDAVIRNPLFAVLYSEPRFEVIQHKLNKNIQEEI